MKDILIINLTRMGDLLQTTPLMAGLKEKYPAARITLLANSAFREICRGIPFIDDLLVFDMGGYRKRLLERKHSLVENYNCIDELISRINTKEYDLTLNLTHSPVSAILASTVRTRGIRGFTIDSEGHRVIKHPWMRYFFNVIPNRIYNPFHLVDIYEKIGEVNPSIKGLVYDVQKEDEERASLLLESEGVDKGEMLVGFHLGASKSDKTWPVAAYARLADMVHNAFKSRILLFGSAGESDLAEEFERNAAVRPLNFVGRTNLGALAALLRRCELFISNDTGPLHIATSVGTKVIDISTGNVHFMETGPYGEGHYVIQADLPCVPCAFDVQCRDMVCKSVISPDAVFSVVREAVKDDGAALSPDTPELKDLQVYKSHFKDDGYIDFSPLIRHSLNKETLFRILYRHVWNVRSEALNGKSDEILENIYREISSCYEYENPEGTMLSLNKEIQVLDDLAGLAGKGMDMTGLIAREAERDELDVAKIKGIWNSIESVDKEIDIIGHANPCFRFFTIFFTYAKESMEGNELKELADAMSDIYRDLHTNSSNMLQLMKGLIPFLIHGPERTGREISDNVIHGT